MQPFSSGPFEFSPAARRINLCGKPHRTWTLAYGDSSLSEKALPEELSQQQVREEFGADIAAFILRQRETYAAAKIELIDSETDTRAGHFFSDSMCGMSAGLIDDRSKYWIRSSDRLYSLPVTIDQYARIVSEHAAHARGWICSLLPEDVLTSDAVDWRAPSSWEIRHVVGEGSFTGVTGAAAAALVGVTAQNFRKYTARDVASTRQNMSFAMWHLLLSKLEIKRA